MCAIWFDESGKLLGKVASRAAHFEGIWLAQYAKLVADGLIPEWR